MDSATMSDHEQARKDDEDDRVYEAAKEYLPECALEFVCTREGLGKLLDADDQWLTRLADCFNVLDHFGNQEHYGVNSVLYMALEEMRNTAIYLAKDNEEVHIAAQKRVTDRD